MLPPEAKTYFERLLSESNADASVALDRKQRAFESDEFARGHTPAGAGFAARLASLYADSLTARANEIAEILKIVHQSFGSPLDEGVDAQMLDWGARSLSTTYQGLEGGYARHLQRFGIDPAHANDLNHAYTLARTTVGNLLGRYLWELRNVPSKRLQPPATPITPLVIHNTGTIGAVQTGANLTANVQQQLRGGDASELRAALAAFREALEQAKDVEVDQRIELIADVDSAVAELGQERPNKGRLLRWLGGIGAVVQTTASLQPAYSTVQSLARMLGVSI